MPALGIAPGGRCDPDAMRHETGDVCLTIGGGGGEAIAVRCFADETIRGGRAIALTGAGGAGGTANEAHSIVPDGACRRCASVRLAAARKYP